MAVTASVWKGKYKTLKDYYNQRYNPKYYTLNKLELEIDPDETVEDMNNYDAARQRLEQARCHSSFFYFASKYIKILHPRDGLIPFVLYDYQRETISLYEKNRFNIIKKFRQGGLTTVSELWALWLCTFKLDQQVLFLSKTDREAIAAGEILNKAVQNLPKWLVPSAQGKWNDHQKQFYDTGGNIFFFTPEAARGRAITLLIVDEAAFIADMEEHWKDMYPTVSAGGQVIVISTVNGMGNWYADTYFKSRAKKNDFNVIDLEYTRHPDYHNDKWVREQKAQLGEKGWRQEVLGSFLGSGETYIPQDIITELDEKTRLTLPKRKKMKKWANVEEASESYDGGEGALWVWKEPQDGHEYIFGIDCAEGVGDEGDNSVIEVFDQATLEQVAEFYSNQIPLYQFSQVVNELGIYYNNALIVVESNGHGSAMLSNLQHDLFYDNLYYDSAKEMKTQKPGVKITQANRPVVLESLQHRMMNNTIRLNSKRIVLELNTFIFNNQTKKVAAQKGKHDDAIMSVCFAIYVLNQLHQTMPVMPVGNVEVQRQMIKSSVYEEIRKEILEGGRQNLLDNTKRKSLLDNEENDMPGFELRRKFDSILKEFSW